MWGPGYRIWLKKHQNGTHLIIRGLRWFHLSINELIMTPLGMQMPGGVHRGVIALMWQTTSQTQSRRIYVGFRVGSGHPANAGRDAEDTFLSPRNQSTHRLQAWVLITNSGDELLKPGRRGPPGRPEGPALSLPLINFSRALSLPGHGSRSQGL